MSTFAYNLTGRRPSEPELQKLRAAKRAGYQPVRRAVVEMDFAEVELRCLARAMDRRAARCGDDPHDDGDLGPLDFS